MAFAKSSAADPVTAPSHGGVLPSLTAPLLPEEPPFGPPLVPKPVPLEPSPPLPLAPPLVPSPPNPEREALPEQAHASAANTIKDAQLGPTRRLISSLPSVPRSFEEH
jgi:hypothetical protein